MESIAPSAEVETAGAVLINGNCGMELSNRQKGDELVPYFPPPSCDSVADEIGSRVR